MGCCLTIDQKTDSEYEKVIFKILETFPYKDHTIKFCRKQYKTALKEIHTDFNFNSRSLSPDVLESELSKKHLKKSKKKYKLIEGDYLIVIEFLMNMKYEYPFNLDINNFNSLNDSLLSQSNYNLTKNSTNLKELSDIKMKNSKKNYSNNNSDKYNNINNENTSNNQFSTSKNSNQPKQKDNFKTDSEKQSVNNKHEFNINPHPLAKLYYSIVPHYSDLCDNHIFNIKDKPESMFILFLMSLCNDNIAKKIEYFIAVANISKLKLNIKNFSFIIEGYININLYFSKQLYDCIRGSPKSIINEINKTFDTKLDYLSISEWKEYNHSTLSDQTNLSANYAHLLSKELLNIVMTNTTPDNIDLYVTTLKKNLDKLTTIEVCELLHRFNNRLIQYNDLLCLFSLHPYIFNAVELRQTLLKHQGYSVNFLPSLINKCETKTRNDVINQGKQMNTKDLEFKSKSLENQGNKHSPSKSKKLDSKVSNENHLYSFSTNNNNTITTINFNELNSTNLINKKEEESKNVNNILNNYANNTDIAYIPSSRITFK